MKRVIHWLAAAILVLLTLQLLAGMLLSVVYIPSTHLHNQGTTYMGTTTSDVVYRGTVLGADTIPVFSERFVVHSDTGIPRIPDVHASAPLTINTKPVTEVEKSLEYDLHQIPLGVFVRLVHAATAHAIVALLVALLVLMVFTAGYASQSALWFGAVVMLVVALALVWLGMLLPNDAYAIESAGIVGSALNTELPFGKLVSDVIGVGASGANLPRVFVMHVLYLPVVALAVVYAFRAEKPTGFLVGTALAISCVALFVAGMPLLLLQEPIWMFRLAHNLSIWIGTELAGYATLLLLTCMVTLPLWHANVSITTVRVLAVAVLSLCVVSAVL